VTELTASGEVVAPEMFAHVDPASVERCHWSFVAPAVPSDAAEKLALEPEHTSWLAGCVVTVETAVQAVTLNETLTADASMPPLRFAHTTPIDCEPVPLVVEANAIVIASVPVPPGRSDGALPLVAVIVRPSALIVLDQPVREIVTPVVPENPVGNVSTTLRISLAVLVWRFVTVTVIVGAGLAF
jgi:hypothetical protein